MKQKSGQKLVRIPQKEHYYYDSDSLVIYYLKRDLSQLTKISSGIKWDGEGSIIRASRIIPKKLEERKSKEKKKKQSLNKLMGDYIDELTDLSSAYHLSKNRPVSKKTLKSYQTTSKHLKEFFEGYLPSELIPEPGADRKDFKDPWLSFVAAMQSEHPNYNMYNLTKHFRSLVKYLHANGIISKLPKIYNPFELKEKVARQKKKGRIFTPDEILMMDVVCSEDQRLVLWLGYDLAFRLDDCMRLTWDRVNLGKAPFIEFHGDDNKTGFVGKVPLSDSCFALLKAREKKGKWVLCLKTDPTSPMLSQQLKFEDIVRESGVRHGSHHTLRHTRLTEDFGNSTLDNAMVMKVRRVSLQVAINHYIHPTETDLEKFRNTSSITRGFS